MQGKIISFSNHDGQGAIIADDGIQYAFNSRSWTEQNLPKAGDNVVFTFDSMSGINAMSYQTSASQVTTPPPIPSHLTNNSRHSTTPPSLQKVTPNHNTTPSQAFNSQHSNYNTNNSNANNQQNGSTEALYTEENNYNIIDWTKKVILNNYANFSGRARRKEYWLFYVGYIILSIVASIIDVILGTEDYGLFQGVLGLALFIPSVAVTARRLHDTDRSGWWQLLWLIPIIGWILLIIWLATETSPQNNRWGSPAKYIQ